MNTAKQQLFERPSLQSGMEGLMLRPELQEPLNVAPTGGGYMYALKIARR